MQTTEFEIPKSITINKRLIRFVDMMTIQDVESYLNTIEKLQVYDPNVVFGKRQ